MLLTSSADQRFSSRSTSCLLVTKAVFVSFFIVFLGSLWLQIIFKDKEVVDTFFGYYLQKKS